MKKFGLIKIIFICLACALFVPTGFSGCEKGGEVLKNGTALMNNIVILVSFADGEGFADDFADGLSFALNEDERGFKAFFEAESLGRLSVTSTVFKEVVLSRDKAYYAAKSFSHPEGYDGKTYSGKSHVDGFFREQGLVREAILKADIPENFDADADGDGFADGVILVLGTEFEKNDERILWPHKSELYEYSAAIENTFYVPEGFFDGVSEDYFSVPEINGAQVGNYAVVSQSSTVGEICHEFTHILGLSDYYSYIESGFGLKPNDNIGKYELLGMSPGDIPQYSLAYLRQKLGWLSEGDEIDVISCGEAEVTLFPVTYGKKQAVKIIPEGYPESGEYFFLEVREKKEGEFDGTVNASGVIIYAVNEENAYIGEDGKFGASDLGNMYGNGKFEVRLITDKGFNYFTQSRGSTGDIAYSDGKPSGVSVSDIKKNDDGSYSFRVFASGERSEGAPPEPVRIADNKILAVRWGQGEAETVAVIKLEATPRTAAAYAVDMMPSASALLGGSARGVNILSLNVYSAATRRVVNNPSAECYLAVIMSDGDGRTVNYKTFHVLPSGTPAADYTFGDVLAVAFAPGNTAFFVCCAVLLLCVLAGFLFFGLRLAKRRSRR